MKILAIANYNFKNMFRNFKSTGIMFILPLVFMGIFGVVFGQSNEDITYEIGMFENEIPYTEDLVDVISQINTSEDSDISLFEINTYETRESAKDAVLNEEILLFLDFSDSDKQNIKIFGDQSNPSFSPIASVLKDISIDFLGIDTSFIDFENILTDKEQGDSSFDILAPGLIIYGILILIPGIAQSFTEITEKKYIFRFFTSQANSLDIIGGFSLYYLGITLVQVLILFLAAQLMGFTANGSLILAYIACIPAGLFSIGLGMIIGSLVDKSDAATNIGSILSIILGFFSGSFIVGIENALTFNFFGQEWFITDIFPSKHATDILQVILRQNGNLGDVIPELLFITITSIVIFILGIWLFSVKKLSAR